MASTAAVTSCQDCSRAVGALVVLASPSPRSKESWSAPPRAEARRAHPEQADALARVDAGQQRGRHLADGATGGDRARPACASAVCSERSLNFTFTVTVRADAATRRAAWWPPTRPCAATWRSSSAGSTRSWLKVSSCPIDLLGRFGLTGIGVLAPGQRGQVGAAGLAQPAHHGVERQRGQVAHRAHAQVVQALRRGRSDAPERLDVVRVEERQLVGRARPGARRGRARARPGWPGAWRRARRAWRSSWSVRCPTAQPRCSSSRTRSRRPCAMASGGPSRRSAPATSMKASSRPIGSTIGVTSREERCAARALTSA